MTHEVPDDTRGQRVILRTPKDERSVTIALQLDGRADGRFILHGRVVRACAAWQTLVIALDAWPERLAASLGAPVRAELQPVEVMIVDQDLARRTRVAAAFRAEGCHVVETGTPLEAINGLVDKCCTTDVIAVADTEPESIGIELRDYLDTACADAYVVAVGDPEWTPSRTRLDAAEAQHLLRAGIQSLLLRRRTDRAPRSLAGGVSVTSEH